MFDEISKSGNPDEPRFVYVPEIDDNLLNAGAIKPDGGDQVAAMALGRFDAQNARAVGQAQAKRQAAEARLPQLTRNAKRAARHLTHTRLTRTVVTREKLAALTWFQII